MPSTIVILGSGGTMADNAAGPADDVGDRAARRSMTDLPAHLPAGVTALQDPPIVTEQVVRGDVLVCCGACWRSQAGRWSRRARPATGFIDVKVAAGTGLLRRVDDEFRDCVVLAQVFLRLWCGHSGHDNLIASPDFSLLRLGSPAARTRARRVCG